MAFGHQMGALWTPWLVKLKFGVLHAPPYSSLGGLMAFVHLIWDMFVYGLGCFLFYYYWTPTGSFPESSVKIRLDLAEILRIRKLDWCDGGGGGKKGRGGILLCNGSIKLSAQQQKT